MPKITLSNANRVFGASMKRSCIISFCGTRRFFAQSMASSIALQVQALQIQGTPKRSHFLGQSIPNLSHKPCSSWVPRQAKLKVTCAKFDLFQLLGGRGLCNGEKGVEQELKRSIEVAPAAGKEEPSGTPTGSGIPDDAFGKEMMGLTGGFPGGEAGLNKFIQENPPPKKQPSAGAAATSSKKPKPPELPLLMPGMIAIVKNPNSPFYMYCGIIQRITDGKAGVLFEGGNWDKLLTFRLEELERREKGPPGKSPKSAVIEPLINQEPLG